MKKLLFVLLVLAALNFAVLPVASQAPTPTLTPTPTPTRDVEEEYYMGMYQGCVLSLIAIQSELAMVGLRLKSPSVLCKTIMLTAYNMDIFDEKEAPKDWSWPPSTPTPTPTPEPEPSRLGSFGKVIGDTHRLEG